MAKKKKKGPARSSGLSATKRRPKKPSLVPMRQQRGLSADQVPLSVEAIQISELAKQVVAVGGTAIGAYHEPLSGRPVLLATVPIKAVQPTPFQRDLSPTHTKRLAHSIEQSGSFLDPLIVVRGQGGEFWTPNGRHRLAAARMLGLRQITVLISPDEELAFRILALNTEKAHNLKDRSLEVIRLARDLARRYPRAKESEFAEQFEAPELITLGIVYDDDKRFAGGAYAPFLKKVDVFSDRTLRASLRQRQDYAAQLLAIKSLVKHIIGHLQERGFKSPYLRSYVVARINPVRFARSKRGERKPLMPIATALTKMMAAANKFDPNSVRPGELALVAALSSSDN